MGVIPAPFSMSWRTRRWESESLGIAIRATMNTVATSLTKPARIIATVSGPGVVPLMTAGIRAMLARVFVVLWMLVRFIVDLAHITPPSER